MVGIILAAFIIGSVCLFFYRRLKLENTELKSVQNSLFEMKEEMRLSLLSGVYHRYKKDDENEKEENPWMFEKFVARIIENFYSGETYVTRGSGDFGVDIEHVREEGLYLGQVKCYAPNQPVGYEPIAIIHSQMIKQNAAGGFVVTTSRFTPKAISYAEDLNIDLIDGLKLIDLWIEGTEKRFKLETPSTLEEKILK